MVLSARCAARSKQRVEPVERLTLETLSDLGVPLEGLGELAVAEKLHDDADVGARLAGPLVVLQEQGAEALSEVVQPHVAQASLSQQPVE